MCSMANVQQAQAALKEYFGYETFRPGQAGVVEAILDSRDTLAVMPTGAGKSICYQVPGVILEGLALVVSPLVSLMGDQVRALLDAGIRGAFLNSSLTPAQQETVLGRAAGGAYQIMYVAPERLADERFLTFAQNTSIPLVAIDEAHCVSQWGQDFRPSYLTIGDFIASLPKRPAVAALTATATERVRADIVRLLDLRDPYQIVTGFDRPNLHFGVERMESKRKMAWIAAYALEHGGDSGIIYCSTRKETDSVHSALVAAGIKAARYHAGMAASARQESQRAFIADDAPVMVATNAFGMGIDKSNVRYVFHHNMPGSIEAYYQEAGRAGRDGEPSTCMLLWNDADVTTRRFFVEQDSQNSELSVEEAAIVRASQRRLLEAMVGYCRTTACLRHYRLNYFGEEEGRVDEGAAAGDTALLAPEVGCGNCSNCEGSFESEDVTETARAVMRCVKELRGRFGKGLVVDTLRGSKSAKVLDMKLDECVSYDTLDTPAGQVKEIIELLVAGNYLAISDGSYPLLGLGVRAREAAEESFVFTMKRIVRSVKPAKEKKASKGGKVFGGSSAAEEAAVSEPLFERLRVLRKRIADDTKVPPYIVFSDATLRAMCVARPTSSDEFLAVSGVGATKLERYGEAFLAEIAAFDAESKTVD